MTDPQEVTLGELMPMDARCDNCHKRFKMLRNVKLGSRWSAWFCERCANWFKATRETEKPFQPPMELK